jgi:hypothetical protein
MVLRWIAAGMGEAAKQFCRVNGDLHLPACGPRSTRRSPPLSHRTRSMPSPDHPGPPPKFHGERDNLHFSAISSLALIGRVMPGGIAPALSGEVLVLVGQR